MAQLVKNPPAMQETRVRSLGREDPLEQETATLSGILAWEIPWTKEPDGLQSTGSQVSDTTYYLNHYHYHHELTKKMLSKLAKISFLHLSK